MDIQVSSNFERLLFEMNDRQGGRTAEQLHAVPRVGRLDVADDVRAEVDRGLFRAARFDDAEVARRDRPGLPDERDVRRPPHRHRHGAAHAGRRRTRWSRWRRPTRPSSPTRSSPPTGVARRCPSTSPTCSSDPSARARPHDLAAVEDFVSVGVRAVAVTSRRSSATARRWTPAWMSSGLWAARFSRRYRSPGPGPPKQLIARAELDTGVERVRQQLPGGVCPGSCSQTHSSR